MIEEIAIWAVLIAIGCGLLTLAVFFALVVIAEYRLNKEMNRTRTFPRRRKRTSSSVINVYK